MLLEAKLPDLLLDLADQYGNAFPRPGHAAVEFTVIHENVSFSHAKENIEALLTLHGVRASQIDITPGVEQRGKTNRRIRIVIPRDQVL